MLLFYQIFVFLNSLLVQAALNRADYPPPLQVPPVNSSWTKLLLQGHSIVDAPLRTQEQPSDWTKEIQGCTKDNEWAFTIDDGVSEFTPLVLEALRVRQTKAASFVIGSNVLNHPQILNDVHKGGHTLGIHTWSHPYLTTLTNDQIIAEVLWTAKIIRDITGVTPSLIRPPCNSLKLVFVTRDIEFQTLNYRW